MEKKYTNKYEVACAILENLENLEQCDELITENSELQTQVNNLQTENTTLSNEVAEKEAYINTAKGITITSNGIYTPEEGVVGYNEINVEVEGSGGGKLVLVDGIKFGNSTFTEIPEYFDFSEVTDFYYMFHYCTKLTSVGDLNTSNGTNFSNMFDNCTNLTSITQLNTSNGDNFYYMFHYCTKLTSVGDLDTANGTNFCNMFRNCTNLRSVGDLNTSNGTDLSGMFYYCTILTTVPSLDTSNCINFQQMFYHCRIITSIPQLDTSKGTNFDRTFQNCTALENITLVGSVNYGIDFSSSSLLTYDSIKSILTACAATTNTSSKTLKFKRTITDQNGELAALVGDCTTKGWTITGLTLE